DSREQDDELADGRAPIRPSAAEGGERPAARVRRGQARPRASATNRANSASRAVRAAAASACREEALDRLRELVDREGLAQGGDRRHRRETFLRAAQPGD